MILYIKHIDIEGPGTLGRYVDEKGFPTRTISLGDDLETIPLDELTAVVCLGGPMNVYDEDRYPFLKQENQFIQYVIQKKIPFLGICLGSQLLAKACGAQVRRSPLKEIGFYDVDINSSGQKDLLFQGIPKTFNVFQWHEDMFLLPENGTLLATSAGCPHQAFRVGSKAYGLQFHVEITDESIREWSHKYIQRNKASQQFLEDMLREYDEKKTDFHASAEKIYDNFFSLMNAAT